MKAEFNVRVISGTGGSAVEILATFVDENGTPGDLNWPLDERSALNLVASVLGYAGVQEAHFAHGRLEVLS